MPKISVLMPIYNTQEEPLREAIESILNQTFKDFEFLILNDSPLNAVLDTVVASYGDSRIRYIRNEQNMGITPSRNKLLQMAEGEYIAVMDHDDISEPERFAKQVEYLDMHPDVGVVGCSSLHFPNGNIYTYPEDDLSIKELLMDVCPILHPSSMLRKAVLDKFHICYEEEYTPAEDYRLWLRLIEHTKFHNLQEVLFRYRKHESRTSCTMATRMGKATARLHAWARHKYPHLWEVYSAEKHKCYIVKLFGAIPIVSILCTYRKTQICLFGIPLLSMRKKERRHPAVTKLIGRDTRK